ncbi:MAG: 4Fe-4S dicluster domain-containing protein, partial [Coriobacteriia bacterium]|nr:4Fe-4S dicluster domain-containing protein [Coriobacteriia bacterium]
QILKQARTACEQCQKCTDLCPRELLGHDVKPHIMMRVANYGLADFASMTHALACTECGACALYACPERLSPRRINALVKQQLAAAGIKNSTGEKKSAASPMLAYRQIPVKRLITRLGLGEYDRPAPLAPLAAADCDPQEVRLLLKQHFGAPASPLVQAGDAVAKGQLVAQMAEGQLGADIHASISGLVSQVDETAIVLKKN